MSETVMLTVIDGETDTDAGVPINLIMGMLPSLETREVYDWVVGCGVDEDHPEVWVLVELAGEALGRCANQVAFREVAVTDAEAATLRAEITDQARLHQGR